MTSAIRDILQKTNQQVGLLDDDKKMEFARQMSGFRGIWAALTGQLAVRDFRTIIEGKNLIAQKATHGHH